ncbi:hypothetical protein [Spirosoma endophyticum]|uniref:Uncharacterized protein n=1 Tax=Spirosoma endophyticum TaxID=662367 RepID=A0A1I1LS44_9BACT|nr:hypothetical protein [Spirosoma endophyticum]SFC73768.1 hypothetical protein SAMN05216167_102273 [Spirosoma endophyticum]
MLVISLSRICNVGYKRSIYTASGIRGAGQFVPLPHFGRNKELTISDFTSQPVHKINVLFIHFIEKNMDISR